MSQSIANFARIVVRIHLFVALSTLWIVPRLESAASPTPFDRPNVLLILIDDLNDWVGFQNPSPLDAKTPHMDALAREGMVFANAHCSAPECAPSRTSLLSGREPWNTGLYFNGNIWLPFLPVEQMLPSVMKANGYYTVGAGKTHHHVMGFNPPSQWHEYFPQQFDDYWTRENFQFEQGWTHIPPRPQPTWFPLNGLTGDFTPSYPDSFDWGPIDAVEPGYRMGDTTMVNWAVEFLQQKRDQPFFLAAGIYRPHLPWYAPRQYFELYDAETTPLPEINLSDMDDIPEAGKRIAAYRSEDFQLILNSGKYREAVRAYRAAISYADAQVGRLLEALRSRGLEENTIVIVTSDHGWHLGEKLHWHKHTLWERATHVPLIIKAPGTTIANTVSHSPVGLIDLYPTLVELCRIPNPPPLDGESLVRQLKGERPLKPSPALTAQGPGNFSARSERFRYIRYSDGTEELYDLENDPQEWTNQANSPRFKEIKETLRASLPQRFAPARQTRNHFQFQPESYTWTAKE